MGDSSSRPSGQTPTPNFGVKLVRPGFGPAAELPALSQARRRHGSCRSRLGSANVIRGNRRAASASARGTGRTAYTKDVSRTGTTHEKPRRRKNRSASSCVCHHRASARTDVRHRADVAATPFTDHSAVVSAAGELRRGRTPDAALSLHL